MTACLTNNWVSRDDGPPTDRAPTAAHEVLALFDHIVESSKVGVRKPDPRFYEIACELAGVDAGRGGVPRRPRREPQAGRRPWA